MQGLGWKKSYPSQTKSRSILLRVLVIIQPTSLYIYTSISIIEFLLSRNSVKSEQTKEKEKKEKEKPNKAAEDCILLRYRRKEIIGAMLLP